MKRNKLLIISLLIIFVVVGIFYLLWNHRIDISHTRHAQCYYKILNKDHTKVDPNIINLVEATDYGLFIDIWKIEKRKPSYIASHIFEISFIKYTVINKTRDFYYRKIDLENYSNSQKRTKNEK